MTASDGERNHALEAAVHVGSAKKTLKEVSI